MGVQCPLSSASDFALSNGHNLMAVLGVIFEWDKTYFKFNAEGTNEYNEIVPF